LGRYPAANPRGGVGTATRQSNITAVYAKTITDRLGIVIEETWTRLDRVAKGTWSAMQNLDTEIKYLAIDDQPHEFLLTFGLDREFGGTGAARVGAFASGATTPRVYFGEGLGDLDIGNLRPLAVAGMVPASRATGRGAAPSGSSTCRSISSPPRQSADRCFPHPDQGALNPGGI
jgi:hypothetical protein